MATGTATATVTARTRTTGPEAEQEIVIKNALAVVIAMTMLLVLLVVGLSGTLGMIFALGLSVLVLTMVALGPDQLGKTMLVVGVFLAPMNALNVVGENVTASDLCLVLAFGLLSAQILRGRPKLPPLFLAGASILLITGLTSSLFSDNPAPNIVAFARVGFAIALIPFLMNGLRPTRRLIDVMAWAYVAGQSVSVIKSVIDGAGPLGRHSGITTQPNFFGLGGQIALALLIYLFYRVPTNRRWIVVMFAVLIGHGILISGSRASLVCSILILVLWPVVERTAASWYVLASAGAILLVSANAILNGASEGSALGRIRGDSLQADYSDQARGQQLASGSQKLFEHPITGSGYDGVLKLHNAYLEVAVGGGIIALVGFLLVLIALIRPLFDPVAPNRLSYMAVSYAAFAALGPTLYDRIVWVGVGMIMLQVLVVEKDDDPPDPDLADPAASARPMGRDAPASPRARTVRGSRPLSAPPLRPRSH